MTARLLILPQTPHPSRSGNARRVLTLAGLLCCAALSGCNIMAIGGVIAKKYQETATRTVEPEYEGLSGKSFAVVVTTDRSIEAAHPGVVDVLTDRLSARLRDFSGATGYITAPQVLKYTYDNPSWISRPRSDLGKALGGVDRIVYVDVYEFRLNEPGNAYEYEGVAAATVAVLEMDSPMPDSHAFERRIQVKYPDKSGVGPNQMRSSDVASVLVARFVDRSSWLFYRHEEKYNPVY